MEVENYLLYLVFFNLFLNDRPFSFPPPSVTSFLPRPLPRVKVMLSNTVKWHPRFYGRDMKSWGMRCWSGSAPVLDKLPFLDVAFCGRPTKRFSGVPAGSWGRASMPLERSVLHGASPGGLVLRALLPFASLLPTTRHESLISLLQRNTNTGTILPLSVRARTRYSWSSWKVPWSGSCEQDERSHSRGASIPAGMIYQK